MTQDRFVVTSRDEVIGFSVWPWDPLYVPVVGCFVGGALQATSDCGETLAQLQPAPFVLRRRSRLKRRMLGMLGLPVPPLPDVGAITLTGPSTRSWFRLKLPTPLVERIRADDAAVRIERLEDGAAVLREGAIANLHGNEPVPVEALLNEPDGVRGDCLDGFAAFLSAPPQHQFEVAFVEYLRRMPEEGARQAYLHALERGDITLFQVRRAILDSDEFRGRRVGYGARLGASLASPLWREFGGLNRPLVPDASALGATRLAQVADSA